MWLTLILNMFTGAGLVSRISRYVVVALVVISISFGLIQYGKNIEKQHILIEQNNNYIGTRGKIDDATKSNPNGDPAISLERLRHPGQR